VPPSELERWLPDPRFVDRTEPCRVTFLDGRPVEVPYFIVYRSRKFKLRLSGEVDTAVRPVRLNSCRRAQDPAPSS